MLDKIKELDKKYYMNTFGERLPVCFSGGEGIKLFSTEGETFYDFMGGIAVNVLGYSHKRLTDTICEQAKKLLHTSSLYYIESQAKLAEVLCVNSFADKAFFCNSGAEANEGAIKLARKYFYNKNAEKYEVITLKNSFHGRTIATLSATGQEKYQKPYKPLLEKFIHIEKNNFSELETAVTPKTGAIILELIQGESGVYPLDLEFVKKVRQLCDEKDIVLIFDEIQTGMGRCGKLFAYQLYHIEPDIMTLAKALAGGVPIGAILCKEKFATFTPGDHGTTFGGNHLATATALTVVDELINNGVIENSFSTGAYFKEKLLRLKEKATVLSEIRGAGLMIGIEFSKDIAKEISKKLFDKGFLVGTIGETTIRLVPPLVITKEEVDLFIENLDEVLNNMN
jgi:acetylornithine aminotransferase/acetylornithine/N-succinyldiaminopimelate aminotransferase